MHSGSICHHRGHSELGESISAASAAACWPYVVRIMPAAQLMTVLLALLQSAGQKLILPAALLHFVSVYRVLPPACITSMMITCGAAVACQPDRMLPAQVLPAFCRAAHDKSLALL